MNRINLLIITILLFIYANSNAQRSDINIQTGEFFDPNGSITSIVGETSSYVYYTSFKRGWYVGGVNPDNLSVTFETKLEEPEFKGKKCDIESVELIGDQLIMLASRFDKEDDKYYFFAQLLNEKGGPEGELTELMGTKAVSKRKAGSYSFLIDSDLGRLLVFSELPDGNKYEDQGIEAALFDKSLSTVWEAELTLPYAQKYFSVSNLMLGDDDRLYMLCSFDEFAKTRAEDGRKKAKEEAAERGGDWFTHKILAFDNKTKKIKEFEVELGTGQAITSVSYSLDQKGNLNVTGLYKQSKEVKGSDGVYFMKIDGVSGSVITSNSQPFGKELIESYLIAEYGEKRGAKAAEKGNGILNYYVDNIINLPDGGVMISGETYNVYTVCTTDQNGRTNCSTHYVYGFIININVTPEGKIAGLTFIPKNQHTVNDGGYYSSYALMTGVEKAYYIFNDNAKNYGPKKKPGKTYPMTAFKNSITTVASIDMNGELEMNPEPKLKVAKTLLVPMKSVRIGQNKIIMLAKAGKKECLIAVTL